MKPLGISEPAAHELAEAVRWYEQRRPGWGGKLFDAITHTIELILAHPEIGAARPGRLPSRQLQVRGFPYKVAYRIRARWSLVDTAHARARVASSSETSGQS